MTDARDNDTSVKKLPAEIPGEVRFLWSRLVTDRLINNNYNSLVGERLWK